MNLDIVAGLIVVIGISSTLLLGLIFKLIKIFKPINEEFEKRALSTVVNIFFAAIGLLVLLSVLFGEGCGGGRYMHDIHDFY